MVHLRCSLGRGVKGLSAKQIQESLSHKQYPLSTIYNYLRQLETSMWVHSSRPISDEKQWCRPKKDYKPSKERRRKPRKVYYESIPIRFSFEDSFLESLIPILERNLNELKESWFNTLNKIVEEYQSVDLKKFYPVGKICTNCWMNHEAFEFLRALSYAIIDYFEEEEEYKELIRNHKFIE